MKINSKFNLLLLPALFFMTVATAQYPTPTMLMGTWKVESLKPKFPDDVTAKQKAKGEKIISEDTEAFTKTGFVFAKQGGLTVAGKQFTWVMIATEKR